MPKAKSQKAAKTLRLNPTSRAIVHHGPVSDDDLPPTTVPSPAASRDPTPSPSPPPAQYARKTLRAVKQEPKTPEKPKVPKAPTAQPKPAKVKGKERAAPQKVDLPALKKKHVAKSRLPPAAQPKPTRAPKAKPVHRPPFTDDQLEDFGFAATDEAGLHIAEQQPCERCVAKEIQCITRPLEPYGPDQIKRPKCEGCRDKCVCSESTIRGPMVLEWDEEEAVLKPVMRFDWAKKGGRGLVKVEPEEEELEPPKKVDKGKGRPKVVSKELVVEELPDEPPAPVFSVPPLRGDLTNYNLLQGIFQKFGCWIDIPPHVRVGDATVVLLFLHEFLPGLSSGPLGAPGEAQLANPMFSQVVPQGAPSTAASSWDKDHEWKSRSAEAGAQLQQYPQSSIPITEEEVMSWYLPANGDVQASTPGETMDQKQVQAAWYAAQFPPAYVDSQQFGQPQVLIQPQQFAQQEVFAKPHVAAQQQYVQLPFAQQQFVQQQFAAQQQGFFQPQLVQQYVPSQVAFPNFGVPSTWPTKPAPVANPSLPIMHPTGVSSPASDPRSSPETAIATDVPGGQRPGSYAGKLPMTLESAETGSSLYSGKRPPGFDVAAGGFAGKQPAFIVQPTASLRTSSAASDDMDVDEDDEAA